MTELARVEITKQLFEQGLLAALKATGPSWVPGVDLELGERIPAEVILDRIRDRYYLVAREVEEEAEPGSPIQ